MGELRKEGILLEKRFLKHSLNFLLPLMLMLLSNLLPVPYSVIPYFKIL